MRRSFLFQIVLCGLLAGCTALSPTSIDTARPAMEVPSFPSTFERENISLEFLAYEWDSDFFTMRICFGPPNEEVWLFDKVNLYIDGQELADGWVATDLQPDRTDGYYCGIVGYPVELVANTTNAELSIGRLTTPGEGDCSKAQRNLKAAKTGIVIDCDPNTIGNEGFVIVEKPDSLSDEAAYSIVVDAFSDTVWVNWRFLFSIAKP